MNMDEVIKRINELAKKVKSGEELKYTLILANVHKKGLQKLELRIMKR